MKYWKVYANNCNVSEPIKELTQDQLDEAIKPLVDQVTESERFQDMNINWDDAEQVQKAVNKVYEQAKTILEENESLSCGDYCIVKQDDVPQERPNMCGFDTELVLE